MKLFVFLLGISVRLVREPHSHQAKKLNTPKRLISFLGIQGKIEEKRKW